MPIRISCCPIQLSCRTSFSSPEPPWIFIRGNILWRGSFESKGLHWFLQHWFKLHPTRQQHKSENRMYKLLLKTNWLGDMSNLTRVPLGNRICSESTPDTQAYAPNKRKGPRRFATYFSKTPILAGKSQDLWYLYNCDSKSVALH